MSLLLLLPLLASSTADNIQISHYPGNNLWQGESLILECRVSGITSQEGGTAVWSRLYHQDGQELAEIIAHDDIKIIQDDRVTFEKRVFQDLAIFKLQIYNVSLSDDGKYSCQTIGSEEDNSRHVIVSVFERDYEFDSEYDDINFFSLEKLSPEESKMLDEYFFTNRSSRVIEASCIIQRIIMTAMFISRIKSL